MSQEKDILQQWRESAVYWEKHAHIVRTMFAPITHAMIQSLPIVKGQSVLDVAGGVGEPALTIAEAIGSSGSVTFTDGVEEMVAAARREAHRRGIVNIKFCECSADSLPFRSDLFDAVVCRLGVMLFPGPQASLREMLRVLKPKAPLSLAVWGPSDANPFFRVVTEVVSRYVESPPEDPDAPGAFRFAESGKLARMLEDAGASHVSERLLQFDLEVPLAPREFWQVRSELSDTLRAKLAKLSSEQVARISQEVEEAARAFFVAGGMRFPAQVLIVSGKK